MTGTTERRTARSLAQGRGAGERARSLDGSNPLTLTLSPPGEGVRRCQPHDCAVALRLRLLALRAARAAQERAADRHHHHRSAQPRRGGRRRSRRRHQPGAAESRSRRISAAAAGPDAPEEARLVVRVGLDFDLWFDRLLAQAGGGVQRGGPGYVDASFAIAALEVRGVTVGPGDGHAHGSGNPHYWLDPKNAEIITGNILEGLARVDPDNAPRLRSQPARVPRAARRQAHGVGGEARGAATACRSSPITTAGPISRGASASTSSASSSRSRACRRRRRISRR